MIRGDASGPHPHEIQVTPTRIAEPPRSDAAIRSALTLEHHGSWLRARFATPHRTLGWTVVGGGFRSSAGVSWLQVTGEDLAPPVDPRRFVLERLALEQRLEEPVLMTGCALDEHVVASETVAGVSAVCVATVGLGNALRIGDTPGSGAPVDTINLLCTVSLPLDDLGLLEALSMAVEARTTAVLEAGVRSGASGLAATGTGTDCVVVAAPHGEDACEYAGKHTAAGAAVGGAVLAAVTRGVVEWRARYGG